MTYYPVILVDSSVMIAFYNSADRYHVQVLDFFTNCTSELVTTVGCVTEVMYFLAPNSRVQNVFLSHLATEVYKCEHLSVVASCVPVTIALRLTSAICWQNYHIII
jgi:uncharacterized protein